MSRKFMWLICVNQLLLWSGQSVDAVHFPAYAQSVGVTFDDLPTIYTVFGLTLMICRAAGGFLFNRCPYRLLTAFFCLQMSYALVLALLPFYGLSVLSLVVFKVLVGQ